VENAKTEMVRTARVNLGKLIAAPDTKTGAVPTTTGVFEFPCLTRAIGRELAIRPVRPAQWQLVQKLRADSRSLGCPPPPQTSAHFY
jgi:hypothetical protein